jgi:hypothetical protein
MSAKGGKMPDCATIYATMLTNDTINLLDAYIQQEKKFPQIAALSKKRLLELFNTYVNSTRPGLQKLVTKKDGSKFTPDEILSCVVDLRNVDLGAAASAASAAAAAAAAAKTDETSAAAPTDETSAAAVIVAAAAASAAAASAAATASTAAATTTPQNASLVLRRLVEVVPALYALHPPPEASFELDMVRLGFEPSRDGKIVTLRNEDGYNFYMEKKFTRHDGSPTTPEFIEDEFDTDAKRMGCTLSNGNTEVSIPGGGTDAQKDAALASIKSGLTERIGSNVDEWSLKSYLYLLYPQLTFGDLTMWILPRRIDPLQENNKFTHSTKVSSKITIPNANSFIITHTILDTLNAINEETSEQLPMCVIRCTIEVTVTEVSGGTPRMVFVYKWELADAFRNLTTKFLEYANTHPTKFSARKGVGLVQKVMAEQAPLTEETRARFPASVQTTSDPNEALPLLIGDYLANGTTENHYPTPLGVLDEARQTLYRHIAANPPTNASRRGIDLITKVDLQTADLTDEQLALFPAALRKETRNPLEAVLLLVQDYIEHGTERNHYPYGSWAECLTPTCLAKVDPVDKRLQNTREGNLEKTSERALEDAVRAWAQSIGKPKAERDKLLDYALQRQRLLDDGTRRRVIRAGSGSMNTLPMTSPANTAAAATGAAATAATGAAATGAAATATAATPATATAAATPATGAAATAATPATAATASSPSPSPIGSGAPSGPPPPPPVPPTPLNISGIRCFPLATFKTTSKWFNEDAVLSSVPCPTAGQPPLPNWLALTGSIVLRAFDELTPQKQRKRRGKISKVPATPNIDPLLVPHLFRVGSKTPHNRLHAVFIALSNQLYFAAQVQEKMQGESPLPSIDEGWQTWFPVLQERLKAVTKDAFGIPTADWRTWFNGIKGTLTQDVDAFLDEINKPPQQIRTWLSSINYDATEEVGTAFGYNAKPPPTGEQEFNLLQNLESLDPEGFLKSHYVNLKTGQKAYEEAVAYISENFDAIRAHIAKWDAKSRKKIFTTISRYLLERAVTARALPAADVAPIINVLNGSYSKTTSTHITLLQAVEEFNKTKLKKVITRSLARKALNVTRRNKKNPAPKKKYGP